MWYRKPLALLALVLFAVPAAGTEGKAKKLALATIEGVVATIEEREGEGGLATLAVVVATSETGQSRTVLLAPRSSCQEIGFDIEEGDRIRARIFVDGEGPAKAHKALNLTRGTMIRFRTLRSVPLWTATGAWRGGTPQIQQGARSGAAQQRQGRGPGGPGGGSGRGSG